MSERDESKDLVSMLRRHARTLVRYAERGEFKSAKCEAMLMERWLEKAEGGVFMKYKKRQPKKGGKS